MWQPSKSTILQVLISIQSMMLATPLPYFNEPGMGTPCDSKASKGQYAQRSLQMMCLIYYPD